MYVKIFYPFKFMYELERRIAKLKYITNDSRKTATETPSPKYRISFSLPGLIKRIITDPIRGMSNKYVRSKLFSMYFISLK